MVEDGEGKTKQVMLEKVFSREEPLSKRLVRLVIFATTFWIVLDEANLSFSRPGKRMLQ